MKSIFQTFQKEFGKWLMDVAKYIATAVVISSIFGGIANRAWVVVVGVACIVLAIVCGVILINLSKKNETKKGN